MQVARLALLCCASLAAGPISFIKPHVPDFYQHQLAPDAVNVEKDADIDFNKAQPKRATVPAYDQTPLWWEDGGGWCCVAAHVNSFYFLEKQYGYDGLFTRDGGELQPWLNQMTYAIEDMAEDLFFNSLSPSEHLRKLEKQSADKLKKAGKTPKPPLSYSVFFPSGSDIFVTTADAVGKFPFSPVKTTFSNLFEAYHHELCRSEDVEIRLEMPRTGAIGEPWWAGSFHVVTGAGVGDCSDKSKMSIAFADPDKRNKWDPVNKKYLPDPTRTRYEAGLPLPIGEIHYEVVEVDASGQITAGIYKGAKITTVIGISPVPEPTSGFVSLLALIGLVCLRRCVRRHSC